MGPLVLRPVLAPLAAYTSTTVYVLFKRPLNRVVSQAAGSKKNIVLMGDINSDSTKWNDDDFLHKKLTKVLKTTPEQCGMVINNFDKNLPV